MPNFEEKPKQTTLVQGFSAKIRLLTLHHEGSKNGMVCSSQSDLEYMTSKLSTEGFVDFLQVK